jgi:hypothetical protein
MADAVPKPPAATSPEPGRPNPGRRSRFRRVLWSAGALALALGGAYLGGRLQSQSRIDELDRHLVTAQTELAALRGKETLQLQQLGELEARRLIHLGILAFDKNNFGIAQDQLRQAATLLESPASQPDAALKALASALRTLELSPTLDLAQQRAALIQLASKFDELRPPQPTSP